MEEIFISDKKDSTIDCPTIACQKKTYLIITDEEGECPEYFQSNFKID